MLKSKKKVSFIYYEERAKLLTSLYKNLSLYYSEMANLLTHFEALTEQVFSNSDSVEIMYRNISIYRKQVDEEVLYARLYLNDDESNELMVFHQKLARISNGIVDIYFEHKNLREEYKDKEKNDSLQIMFMGEFSEVVKRNKVEQALDFLYEEGQENIESLKAVLKKTLVEN
ncbi:hypothetical protein SAMN02745116_01395 [Pilibacter termitis]|uniref:Uncharacterized protein n=2 Tax=Pilibacter termitis TaxID=263852 RepID=A0A1T4NDS5_9ENTE|nr:hypothetical protein SAMN02745116_01395 [Pilibacter termitis]